LVSVWAPVQVLESGLAMVLVQAPEAVLAMGLAPAKAKAEAGD
jgi:hypothetical protein